MPFRENRLNLDERARGLGGPRVPDTFQLAAISAFFSFRAYRVFYNLRVFNEAKYSDSPRLHTANYRLINRLLVCWLSAPNRAAVGRAVSSRAPFHNGLCPAFLAFEVGRKMSNLRGFNKCTGFDSQILIPARIGRMVYPGFPSPQSAASEFRPKTAAHVATSILQ